MPLKPHLSAFFFFNPWPPCCKDRVFMKDDLDEDGEGSIEAKPLAWARSRESGICGIHAMCHITIYIYMICIWLMWKYECMNRQCWSWLMQPQASQLRWADRRRFLQRAGDSLPREAASQTSLTHGGWLSESTWTLVTWGYLRYDLKPNRLKPHEVGKS